MTATVALKKLVSLASDSAIKLKSIGQPLWKILTFSPADDRISPKKVICVSIEKGGLSVVLGSRFFSRIKIKGFRRYSIEEDRYPQPEGLASSVALAMNNLGATRADVTLSIPKAWTIMKTAEFPSTVKENLSSALSYELDRLTPFNADEALYDFRILREDQGKLTLLVMAAKSDLIKPYLDALGERGINVSRVTVNLSGTSTFCHYIDKRADFIVVEVNNNEYEGALLLDGSIASAFTGSFSAGDETSMVDTILTDIKPLVDVLEKQGKSPQVILITKDKSPAFKEMLKTRINLPVKIPDETNIGFRLPRPQKEVSYATIGGVLDSLWTKAKGLNLLQKGLREKQKTPFALTTVLILIILALCALYMVAPLRIENKRLKEIDQQITLRKEDVKKVEALKKERDTLSEEVSTIDNFKGNKPMVLSILKELTTILPQTTWLTRVRVSETTVNIEGYAESATGLLSKLEASKYFRKAEFASPTFRDTRQNADRFIIKMEKEGVKKEEVKKPGGVESLDEEE
jgi:Tfp pilus assembly protein PilN